MAGTIWRFSKTPPGFLTGVVEICLLTIPQLSIMVGMKVHCPQNTPGSSCVPSVTVLEDSYDIEKETPAENTARGFSPPEVRPASKPYVVVMPTVLEVSKVESA